MDEDKKEEIEEKFEEQAEKEKERLKNVEVRKKENGQVRWAVVLMASMIVIVFAVPFILENYVNSFVYLGLDFQKTKMGEIIFYSTRIPLSNIQGNVIGSHAINFRNDPRELEYIEVNVPRDIITFKNDEIVYISLESYPPRCEDNVIAVAGLTGFLKDFGAMEVKGSLDDEAYANESGFPYITCENAPKNTVIHISSGDVTKIQKVGDNCYELSYVDCEINQVAEKFGFKILEHYMSYFIREG